MKKSFNLRDGILGNTLLFLLPLILFWVVLFLEIPYSFSHFLSAYSFIAFLIVLLLYYLCERLPDRYRVFASFCLTMLLMALPLSYRWAAGYSDNMLIGGLLPYKDARNYYYGANLILDGLPLIRAVQATERPLFPGFLATLFLFTGQNLKLTLALITQLAAIGLYFSARQVRDVLGGLAASLLITFNYFYIQPLVGYTLSESLGFVLGCFAFSLLWRASQTLKWFDLQLGLFVLLMAVSARAGAFLIFPMLVLWAGWIFRGEKRFSIRTAAYTLLFVLVGYVLLNNLYARFLGIPPGSTFGNFSYAFYGQVRGGTGWHSAIEELGTRDPGTVYRAALQFFLKHPLSLLIGFAKSYRDFFLPIDPGIFPFKLRGWQYWFDIGLWVSTLLLLIMGFIRVFRNIRTNNSSLIIAGFLGVFLSIPFLPPVDGGARFHASTVSFFFVLPAVGVAWLARKFDPESGLAKGLPAQTTLLRVGSVLLLVLTLIVPLVTRAFGREPVYTSPSCPSGQKSFVIETHPGSYIDLVKDGTTRCGFLPEICFSDFESNNTEKSTDDYYQTLITLADREADSLRVIPATNLQDERFHYFFISQEKFPAAGSGELISGCAVEIETKNQSIYYVEAIQSNSK